MASSPPRGRSTSPNPPGAEREQRRSNSPISILTRGGIDQQVPRGIDLPAGAYGQFSSYVAKYGIPARPGFNKSGQDVVIGLNSFNVKQLPNQKVHQFDVSLASMLLAADDVDDLKVTIGNGNEKRGLIRAVWESPTMQRNLGPHWVFDGNKIAWTASGIAHQKSVPVERQSFSFEIDMDKERGESAIAARNARANKSNRPQAEPKDNTIRVQLRYATSINLATLDAYVSGKFGFDDSVLQAINFLNHLMRHNPSKNLITIGKSFFPKNWSNPYELMHGLYAVKGIFQSIRPANGNKMVVNVDVSHACFFKNRRMDHIAVELADGPSAGAIIKFVQKNQKDPPYGPYKESPLMDRLRRLKKVGFTVDYRGVSDRIKGRKWIVKDIMYTNAKNTFFDMIDKNTGEKKKTNVDEYFAKQYGFRLENPLMPLVETTKKGIFYPMEVCFIDVGQRWPFKLNERQTADMIKFAVSRPDQRMRSIQEGLGALNWRNDMTLKAYGLQMADKMIETKAKLLTPPKVQFGGGATESPGTSGRWRIDKKKFYRPNTKPLQHWGICLITGKGNQITQQEVMAFLREFTGNYRHYGGIIQNATPALFQHGDHNLEAAVDGATKAVENKFGKNVKPQFILYILPRKETFMYQQLKRHCDLKYGYVSQMVQSAHVQRNQPQYIGNVLMKLNAKLGGQSFKAMPIQGPVASRKGAYFSKPTMVIGADVSHPGPGIIKPSFAAVTVSMDRDAIRYGGAVQSNGHRLEMITAWNWSDMLGPLIREWASTIGGGRLPSHIIYFRDGVSEGQFQHIIQQEVRDIRNVFKDNDNSAGKQSVAAMKFTVIVASKRHHIRFFPKPGPASDRNKNACPGVLVERDVTAPQDYDFYLCSHSAIQGTARPTHYTVIMDQEQMEPTFLQNMIYEHCYQYIRSSTPVSIYPAVYYAHLASRRAVAHERTQEGPLKQHRSSEQRERELLLRAKGEADQTGKVMTKEAVEKLKYYLTEEYPPLHPTVNDQLWKEMWYI